MAFGKHQIGGWQCAYMCVCVRAGVRVILLGENPLLVTLNGNHKETRSHVEGSLKRTHPHSSECHVIVRLFFGFFTCDRNGLPLVLPSNGYVSKSGDRQIGFGFPKKRRTHPNNPQAQNLPSKNTISNLHLYAILVGGSTLFGIIGCSKAWILCCHASRTKSPSVLVAHL